MKPGQILLAILFIATGAARAQEVPAAPGSRPAVGPETAGPSGLTVGGTLHYDLRYSESTGYGNGQDGQQWSISSGDASYANTNQRLPFTMQYGGGYSWAWNGPPSAGGVFQHLSLSQGIVRRAWNLMASENVSYTFETPTTGFSGVPGSGEPIGEPVSNPLPDQTILTQNTRSLDNFTTMAIGHRLDYATTLNIGGSWGQMRFIDKNGQNSETLMADAGLTRRLNARNSVSGQYSFSRYSYNGASFATQTNTLQFGITRQWNRRITTSAAAGPIRIASSGISGTGSTALPASTTLFLDASASYQFLRGSAGLSYSRGTTAGSGYMLGSKVNSVNANLSRTFGRSLTVGVTGSYVRSSSIFAAELLYDCQGNLCLVPLSITPLTGAKYGGAQATRQLGRYINVFANYTAISQSSNLQIAVPNTPVGYDTNILNGLNQMIGFGIGYSPRETRLKK